jgi:hypothetical protein
METIMNPCHYDTENFVFTYLNKHGEKALTIKRKNADLNRYDKDSVYKTFYEGNEGFSPGLPACIDIAPLFSEDTSADIHIHKVGQFFTPWFKATKDCRIELEYGIKRFYALEAYHLLESGPDQFAHALKGHRKTYDDILARVPELYKKRDETATLLKKNFQDKGVSTGRGSTIFDTINHVWVMYETAAKHPDKPEYLWSVSHFTPAFRPAEGFTRFVEKNGGLISNQSCFEFIMQQQKEIYGGCATDLDKVEFDITRIHAIIAQLELILDIPFAKTAVLETTD